MMTCIYYIKHGNEFCWYSVVFVVQAKEPWEHDFYLATIDASFVTGMRMSL